jgi:hypothetical protein
MRERQVQNRERRFVHAYRQALDQFRGEGREAPFLDRMSELVSLHELTTTLGSGLASEETLDAALLIVMRELQVERGAFFVLREDGSLALRASQGLPPGVTSAPAFAAPRDDITAVGPGDEAHDRQGLVLLVPIHRRDRPIAILGLGPREEGRSYGAEERAFLQSVAACAASPIESSLIYDELRRVRAS